MGEVGGGWGGRGCGEVGEVVGGWDDWGWGGEVGNEVNGVGEGGGVKIGVYGVVRCRQMRLKEGRIGSVRDAKGGVG